MRSCCWSEGRPAREGRGVDRGCPLGTALVRLVWHACGTASEGKGPRSATRSTHAGAPVGRLSDRRGRALAGLQPALLAGCRPPLGPELVDAVQEQVQPDLELDRVVVARLAELQGHLDQ